MIVSCSRSQTGNHRESNFRFLMKYTRKTDRHDIFDKDVKSRELEWVEGRERSRSEI